MIHLVYLDNKEKVLEKIMSGKKTMIIRGAAGRTRNGEKNDNKH